ncbi:hypothetical protein SPRG_10769 [Saprolegnia parasitica CBS 223.65]|uniref:Uncharacterized protein n=1 Tax=Saprolegnia parasitica (strain CBS 223.65) TaxID=695850 RepID=A0A067BYH3_SAPPC|nr:hypothetical protein SPRG_10769 [Saprolegnia parasitica CBS 223.65]KDO23574.1 hypothetical protein SPRG_10769 [Saprolegnia parasitica CBS 223.65]|eukprot:XP_012205723.1 hypothetical protein SPRG_10769 [Saprolegnia parasitica CBS 223.65]
MRRRGRVTQEEIAMDNIRQLQGQIHDMQRDKANLLSENQDLASALNLTRSDLASARKKTIELQMAIVRRNVSDAKAKPTIAMRDASVQCSLKVR